MQNALTTKLSHFADFSVEDLARLQALTAKTVQRKAGETLIAEGDTPDVVFLLLEGWAFRYKDLEDGRRQIVAFLIPGDLCDIHIFILKQMDHSIGLLSDATVATISRERMLALMEESPAITRALWWATLVDEAVLREWLVSAGQRDAHARIAHLFCEMALRLNQVGLAGNGPFTVPLTQDELGDTMGLTPVHVNRVLKRMRTEGLVSRKGKRLEILDVAALQRVADFNPNYLHLG